MEAGTAEQKTAAAALAHPVRVQILVIANKQAIGPSRYVQTVLGIDKAEEPEDYKRALSHVSYHFRALEKAGCLEIVEQIPRRGSVEHIYGAVQRAVLDEEDWKKIPPAERHRVLTVAWQWLGALVEAARISHTLDRDDTVVAWTAAELDEQGFAEMQAALMANYAELEKIREDSEARLEESGRTPIPATFALLGFESPDKVFHNAPAPTKRPGDDARRSA